MCNHWCSGYQTGYCCVDTVVDTAVWIPFNNGIHTGVTSAGWQTCSNVGTRQEQENKKALIV